MSRDPEHSAIQGMTVNERLFHLGLLDKWSRAVTDRNRSAMLALMRKCEVETPEFTVDTVLADPETYGFGAVPKAENKAENKVFDNASWPELDWAQWRETAIALQLRCQIVGKVRLALAPWLNHSWHVPFYITARGWTTSAIPAGERILQIDFDLVGDRVLLATSEGDECTIPLAPGSIADFHGALMAALHDFGIDCDYDPRPSEMPDALPFAEDHAQRPYDADAARRFWRALIQVQRVFGEFRTSFLGKASPIHLFWGSFDLASTRFSGRTAPRHPGGMPGLPDAVTCEAYSHEEASVGFWPGSDAYPHAAFYAYAYPAPAGYAEAKIAPAEAMWHAEMGEFLLPYDAVRAAPDPDAALMAFCQSTYDAAADLGKWDRAALDCPRGAPRVPRPV
jgi:hypothetical protein